MADLRMTPVEQPEQMKSYWKREWKSIAAVAVFGTSFNAAMSFGPVLQGRLLDTIIAGKTLQGILVQALLFFGTILAIQLMRFVKRYYVRLFANRTSASMRLMLYNNIINRSREELLTEQAGDLMTRAVADVDICAEGMRKVTTEVFDTGVLMAGYFAFMLSYDWKITLLAGAFVPVAMGIAEKLKKVIVKNGKAARSQNSLVADRTYEQVEHLVLYRIHGMEEHSRELYFKELAALEEKSVRAGILENSMQPLYNVIALTGVVFVLYLGGCRVIDGVWTVGMLSAYIAMFMALTTKASKAAKLFNAYQKASVSWLRIKPYLKDYVKPETQDRCPENQAKTLKVTDVSFSYPGTEKKIVNHISFEAKAGEIIGITGAVACGKTTLGEVLQGNYAYQGSIQIENQELCNLNQTEKSSRIAFMGHQPQLLSDTIEQNVSLGREGDVQKVLEEVCFLEDLESMQEGIRTVVGNSGVRLSGGQQARIALARTLFSDAPILILDDPFSAVDPKTERAILENLRKNNRNAMILLISHRLAAFPALDRVLYMEQDGTAAVGTHEELRKKNSSYAALYELQAGQREGKTS